MAEIRGESLKNKKNRYHCDGCGKSIITIDRDEGVTPMFLRCRRTERCPGRMTSRFYQVEDVWGEPTYEFRKPTTDEYKKMDSAMRDHVDQGGLTLHAITEPAMKEIGE